MGNHSTEHSFNMPREIISIALGQCGVQVCNAAWELFALEHGIQKDGTNPSDTSVGEEDDPHNTFFAEVGNRNVPRCVFVDLEPTVCDEIKTGEYRGMFNPDSMITNKEDAASNYARGHFMMQSYAPVISKAKTGHEQHTTAQITAAAFNPENFLVKCDPRGPDNQYLSVCLLYRGDVVVKDMNASVATIKNKDSVEIVSWNPTGFKQGVNNQEPIQPEDSDMAPTARSLLNIANSTSIKF